MIRFFHFVLVALVLFVVALLSAVTTMHFAIHGAEVRIPDFRGMNAQEAAAKAAALDLNLSVDNRFYSTEMPAGRVLTQSPAAGTVVRREWHVRVTQSLGPQHAAIPNVLGQPERAATIAIRRDGLDIGNVARMPMPNSTTDTVVAQNPAPDAEGMERPSISLLVSETAPATPQGLVMPDLTGQLLPAATLAITRAGLKLAPSIEVPVPPQSVPAANSMQAPVAPLPPGSVIGQNPAAGHRVDATTPIQLTVAR